MFGVSELSGVNLGHAPFSLLQSHVMHRTLHFLAFYSGLVDYEAMSNGFAELAVNAS